MYRSARSRELMLQKDYVSIFGSWMWSSLVGYKLIMVSRVPGYGHLEYLELDIIFDLVTLKLIELG